MPGQLPLGVAGQLVSFRPLSQAEERQLLDEAQIIAASEKLARGIGPAAGAVGGAALPAAAAVVPIPPLALPGLSVRESYLVLLALQSLR